MARRHANALSTQAAQIPKALQHHERHVATPSAHTLEANISHDTTKHPAYQRRAAFTPACFALPSGTAPCTKNRLLTQAAQIPKALQHHERHVATPSAHTLEANISHDTTKHPAYQRRAAFTPACFALPSGTAPCTKNRLLTQAAQIPKALQHHERHVATPSAHTLEANISHDTTKHPAYQRRAAFTPACFALPSGTAPCTKNRLLTQAAQIPKALQHHERHVATPSAHTLEANISHDTTNHPAHQRHAAFTPACFALPSGTEPRKRTLHQGCANPNGTATSRTSCRHTVCPHTGSSHASVSYETSSKSHASRLQDEHFVRDLLQKSHIKSPKRAFRTRLPQKVLQNERFVRDFLKTHMSKSAKRAFRTRLPQKVKRKHPSEHTHITQPCQAVSRFEPSKQHPLTRQSQCNSDIHLYTTTHNLTIPCACHESFRVHTSNAHKVRRLPRNVTSVTPCNLTIPCACHENRTSTPQTPHKVLRLPRKVTISSHVSFNKICVWNDFDPTLPPTKIAVSAETCHENRASMQHPETQIPMARPHPTPQNHDSPNANPNGTAQQTADLTKRCTCAVKSSSTLRHLTFPHGSSLFHTNLTRHVSIRNLLPKLPPMARPRHHTDGCGRWRTVANGCGRLRTRKQRRANTALPSDSQVKREPFATHSGKLEQELTSQFRRRVEGMWARFIG